MLRAGRPTDLGIAFSTIAVLAILVIFLFPLLSRSNEPARPRHAVAGAALQQTTTQAPAPEGPAPQEDSHRQSLVEISLGLTLILGVALLAMAAGSRGRPS